MSDIKTLTVKDLRKLLNRFPPSTRIFISSDSEGNSFGSLNEEWSPLYSKEDNTLLLHQHEDHLIDEQVIPILDAKIMKELEEEKNARQANQRS